MSSVQFNIINNTTISDHLVVVQPQIADLDISAVIHEWRALAQTANGGGSTFPFAGVITATVSDGSTFTPRTSVPLGSLLPVNTSLNGGLSFGALTVGDEPTKAYVRNDSSNPKPLIVTWHVDDIAVMSEGGLNQQSTASLQLTSTLAFSTRTATSPKTMSRINLASVFSPATMYTIPQSAEEIQVTWTRSSQASRDVFTFAPLSA